eukprot:3420321-Lingulodinium_polyedra.AAC.1
MRGVSRRGAAAMCKPTTRSAGSCAPCIVYDSISSLPCVWCCVRRAFGGSLSERAFASCVRRAFGR